MCRAVKCRKCGKTTWAGCGMHVDQVMAASRPLPGARQRAQRGRIPGQALRPVGTGGTASSLTDVHVVGISYHERNHLG